MAAESVLGFGDDDLTEFSDSVRAKRGKGWTNEEDCALAKAWKDTSVDSVHGTDQDASTFWATVQRHFAALCPTSARDAKGMQNRWNIVRPAVTRFCGYYKKAHQVQHSGWSEQDDIAAAGKAYSRLEKTTSGKPKVFKFLDVWHILKSEAKWLKLMSASDASASVRAAALSPSRAASPAGVAGVSQGGSEDISRSVSPCRAPLVRPIGNKAAKADIRTNAHAAARQTGINDVVQLRVKEHKLKTMQLALSVFEHDNTPEGQETLASVKRGLAEHVKSILGFGEAGASATGSHGGAQASNTTTTVADTDQELENDAADSAAKRVCTGL
eukprot:CAMPEP_0114565702 /NCGR_PEP_ID=MMETSP0114-20121206/14461_1 /TAXON_ID=31324 /ORGANISM="Goniomonas sp, Strain m" /LENGTH=327 /DNA_ID=CAMNT_0001751987 /DNA_START=10 /DNA_END=993 /DNA_ORIENTATION=+